MQSIIDAAAQIASEIERTRIHLEKLEQALNGLRPLMLVEAPQSVLSYTSLSDIQTVEDVSVVRPLARKTAARKPKSIAKVPKVATDTKKSKVSKNAKAFTATGTTTKAKASSVAAAAKEKLPKTGNAIWLKALGRKKLTHNQLTDATLSLLKLGEEAKATFRSRAGAWLNTAVKKNQVTAGNNRAGIRVYEAIPASPA